MAPALDSRPYGNTGERVSVIGLGGSYLAKEAGAGMVQLRYKGGQWIMKRRPLGKTGESLSVIGFGAIVFCNEGPEFAHDTVARAIDAGVNYFDMGPAYGKGEAEERGGPAIEPYRDRIFLTEKTGERTKEGAAAQLRQSLERMRTDHFELYQFHGV